MAELSGKVEANTNRTGPAEENLTGTLRSCVRFLGLPPLFSSTFSGRSGGSRRLGPAELPLKGAVIVRDADTPHLLLLRGHACLSPLMAHRYSPPSLLMAAGGDEPRTRGRRSTAARAVQRRGAAPEPPGGTPEALPADAERSYGGAEALARLPPITATTETQQRHNRDTIETVETRTLLTCSGSERRSKLQRRPESTEEVEGAAAPAAAAGDDGKESALPPPPPPAQRVRV
ncbi:tripartite motif-containing protein 21 [Sarotherodon galilaeus]